MNRFTAEFPISNLSDDGAFLDAVRSWIENSPHNTFTKDQIEKIGVGEVSKVVSRTDTVETFRYSDDSTDTHTCAVIFRKRTEQILWTTEITFSKDHIDCWVGISVGRSAAVPVEDLPDVKKPRAIEYFLNKLGGSVDGLLEVQEYPHVLSDQDLDIAIKIAEIDFQGRLPVAYVSCEFLGGYALDAGSLAAELAGLAHVVVEPDRKFSRLLQQSTGSKNVYGGTIGLYWPETGERDIFYQNELMPNPKRLKEAIYQSVCNSLANRSLLSRNTIQHTQALVSARTIAELRKNISATKNEALDKWASEFDAELKLNAQTIESQRERISELENLLRVSATGKITTNSMLKPPSIEQEFFAGEFNEIVLDALKRQVDMEQNDSRRQHVVSAFIVANKLDSAILSQKKDELKKALSGYSRMSPEVRKALERIGFIVTDDGKHIKLTYKGDDRYTFTLAKTGSDHRGSKNAISDIAKRLF